MGAAGVACLSMQLTTSHSLRPTAFWHAATRLPPQPSPALPYHHQRTGRRASRGSDTKLELMTRRG